MIVSSAGKSALNELGHRAHDVLQAGTRGLQLIPGALPREPLEVFGREIEPPRVLDLRAPLALLGNDRGGDGVCTLVWRDPVERGLQLRQGRSERIDAHPAEVAARPHNVSIEPADGVLVQEFGVHRLEDVSARRGALASAPEASSLHRGLSRLGGLPHQSLAQLIYLVAKRAAADVGHRDERLEQGVLAHHLARGLQVLHDLEDLIGRDIDAADHAGSEVVLQEFLGFRPAGFPVDQQLPVVIDQAARQTHGAQEASIAFPRLLHGATLQDLPLLHAKHHGQQREGRVRGGELRHQFFERVEHVGAIERAELLGEPDGLALDLVHNLGRDHAGEESVRVVGIDPWACERAQVGAGDVVAQERLRSATAHRRQPHDAARDPSVRRWG